MTHTVRCPSCFRVEAWSPPGASPVDRAVVTEGGGRRPAVHPALAAWRILDAARTGASGPVVGACPACALPLVAEPGAPLTVLASWTLESDLGSFTVTTDQITGPDGSITPGELTERLSRAYDERLRFSDIDLGRGLFASALLFPLLGLLITVWLIAVSVVVLFLWSGFAFQMGR